MSEWGRTVTIRFGGSIYYIYTYLFCWVEWGLPHYPTFNWESSGFQFQISVSIALLKSEWMGFRRIWKHIQTIWFFHSNSFCWLLFCCFAVCCFIFQLASSFFFFQALNFSLYFFSIIFQLLLFCCLLLICCLLFSVCCFGV